MTLNTIRDRTGGLTVEYCVFPFGCLRIVSKSCSVVSVSRTDCRETTAVRSPVGEQVFREISEYLRGERMMFSVPFIVSGSGFQEKVWTELRRIPYGETRSYGEIAAAVGQPGACRAVGNAVGKNPLLLLIPCHRVIRSDGSFGGFSAGGDLKASLLILESRQKVLTRP